MANKNGMGMPRGIGRKGIVAKPRTCGPCHGTGYKLDRWGGGVCNHCQGTGRVR